MRKFSTTSAHKLIIHSGIGAEHYLTREEGLFEVRYTEGLKHFKTLVSAYLFYLLLEKDASIWDMTDQPTLVESKQFV